jgi:hypothetical protein
MIGDAEDDTHARAILRIHFVGVEAIRAVNDAINAIRTLNRACLELFNAALRQNVLPLKAYKSEKKN